MIVLKSLNWNRDRVNSAFRERGNRELDDAPPGALEVSQWAMGCRADLTDLRLEASAHFLKEFELRANAGGKAKVMYWSAYLLMLGGIMQDLLILEMAHYACVFYPLLAEAEQLLKDPNHRTKSTLRTRIRKAAPQLDETYKLHVDALSDFRNMRNFIAHSGGLYGANVADAGTQETFYIGYIGSDIFANELLKNAGFFERRHTEHAYELERGVDWYNRFVDMIDAVRQTAVETAPLFDPKIPKLSSPHGIWDLEGESF